MVGLAWSKHQYSDQPIDLQLLPYIKQTVYYPTNMLDLSITTALNNRSQSGIEQMTGRVLDLWATHTGDMPKPLTRGVEHSMAKPPAQVRVSFTLVTGFLALSLIESNIKKLLRSSRSRKMLVQHEHHYHLQHGVPPDR